jgi:hypothetical protein
MEIRNDSMFCVDMLLIIEARRGIFLSISPDKIVRPYRVISSNGGNNRAKIGEPVLFYKKEDGYLNEHHLTKLDYYETLKEEIRTLIRRT